MYDESALRRWMSLEMRKINDGVVSARVPLSHLLEMERPVAVTRGGREHVFDRDVIRKIGEALPARLRSALRLPIVFYFDMDVADSCMCADDVALAVLQELGELSRERRMADGRAWVGRAIVFALVRKYPTAVQIMMR
jgi:hypothetical protein